MFLSLAALTLPAEAAVWKDDAGTNADDGNSLTLGNVGGLSSSNGRRTTHKIGALAMAQRGGAAEENQSPEHDDVAEHIGGIIGAFAEFFGKREDSAMRFFSAGIQAYDAISLDGKLAQMENQAAPGTVISSLDLTTAGNPALATGGTTIRVSGTSQFIKELTLTCNAKPQISSVATQSYATDDADARVWYVITGLLNEPVTGSIKGGEEEVLDLNCEVSQSVLITFYSPDATNTNIISVGWIGTQKTPTPAEMRRNYANRLRAHDPGLTQSHGARHVRAMGAIAQGTVDDNVDESMRASGKPSSRFGGNSVMSGLAGRRIGASRTRMHIGSGLATGIGGFGK
jgi:hypothetical protein